MSHSEGRRCVEVDAPGWIQIILPVYKRLRCLGELKVLAKQKSSDILQVLGKHHTLATYKPIPTMHFCTASASRDHFATA